MLKSRGTVLETSKGRAILLMEDGSFKKIRTGRYVEVGETYEVSGGLALMRYAAVAAVFFIILLGTIDFFNIVAYAHLSPGVELGMNRWDRVVSVKTNGEASRITDDLNLAGQPIETAIQSVLNEVEAKNTGESEVSISVITTRKNNNKLEQRIMFKIGDTLDETMTITTKTINNRNNFKEEIKVKVKSDKQPDKHSGGNNNEFGQEKAEQNKAKKNETQPNRVEKGSQRDKTDISKENKGLAKGKDKGKAESMNQAKDRDKTEAKGQNPDNLK